MGVTEDKCDLWWVIRRSFQNYPTAIQGIPCSPYALFWFSRGFLFYFTSSVSGVGGGKVWELSQYINDCYSGPSDSERDWVTMIEHPCLTFMYFPPVPPLDLALAMLGYILPPRKSWGSTVPRCCVNDPLPINNFCWTPLAVVGGSHSSGGIEKWGGQGIGGHREDTTYRYILVLDIPPPAAVIGIISYD